MSGDEVPGNGVGDDEVAWFTARIVLKCRIGGKPGKPATFEERLILVQAENERAARQKAE